MTTPRATNPAPKAEEPAWPSPRKSTPTPQADETSESVRKVRNADPSEDRTSHAKPDAGDEHIGATEQQVSKTTPPSPDDDEPKQG
jgi:hypothetical protein